MYRSFALEYRNFLTLGFSILTFSEKSHGLRRRRARGGAQKQALVPRGDRLDQKRLEIESSFAHTGWTNMAEVPCFRNSFMYGIGAGVVTGVVYNLALSRNPMKLAFSTYGLVTFGKLGAVDYCCNHFSQVIISNADTITARTSWR